jgi:drug/metabolite transporter (DMT)-like permease
MTSQNGASRGGAERAGTGWLPVVVAVAVVVVWGASSVFTKIAAREIDPVVVGIARTVLGGIVAAPLALAFRITLPKREHYLAFGISAFCGFIAFPIMFSIGQRMTSAMHGGLILAVLPIFTGLVAAVVERRAPAGRWWLGCAIAFAGEIVLVTSRASGAAESSLAGDLLILLASLLAASGYVAGARLTQARYASMGATLWGIAAASLILLPGLPVANGGWTVPSASLLAWGAVVFLAWITSIVGYIGWYWALGHGGIARMGTIQFLQPLSGLVLAFFLLGERPTLPLGIATVLILLGVVIARRR